MSFLSAAILFRYLLFSLEKFYVSGSMLASFFFDFSWENGTSFGDPIVVIKMLPIFGKESRGNRVDEEKKKCRTRETMFEFFFFFFFF